jgi:NTP pyrophosphatase (non-canonical NTP hydrolase)
MNGPLVEALRVRKAFEDWTVTDGNCIAHVFSLSLAPGSTRYLETGTELAWLAYKAASARLEQTATPVLQSENIDTPEFWTALSNWRDTPLNLKEYARRRLIKILIGMVNARLSLNAAPREDVVIDHDNSRNPIMRECTCPSGDGSLRWPCLQHPPAAALSEDMQMVMAEVDQARRNWPPFNSAHEGYAVLSEEVDELWEHIKTNQKRRDLPAMKKEAMQVAAMALRFMAECCSETTGRK